jgi:hypothetical protein
MAKKTIVDSVTDAVVDLKDSVVEILTPPAKAVIRAEQSAEKAVMGAGRRAIRATERAVTFKKKPARKTARKAVSRKKGAAKKAAKKVAGRKKHL